MKIQVLKSVIAFLLLIFSQQSFAKIVYAAKHDDWDKNETWQGGVKPTAQDTVVIDGFIVTLDKDMGHVTIKSLVLSNTNSNFTQLIIDATGAAGDVSLTVTENLTATQFNNPADVNLLLKKEGILNVNNNVIFTKDATNQYDNPLVLHFQDESIMNVGQDFTYDYKNADPNELINEIHIDGNSTLNIIGNLNLNIHDGGELSIHTITNTSLLVGGNIVANMFGGKILEIVTTSSLPFVVEGNTVLNNHNNNPSELKVYSQEGSFLFKGNVIMDSNQDGNKVSLIGFESDNAFDIDGNVEMNANSSNNVCIHLWANSRLFIAGNFIRTYGSLLMNVSSKIVYNGTTVQTIAPRYVDGGGTDIFHYSEIELQNSAGFNLVDTLVLRDDLSLSDGKMTTDSNTILIMEDSAMIIGGSNSAFISGPVLKRGRSIGDFEFPVGKGENYAPLRVSEITDLNSEVRAEYFSDPPPFELPNTYESGLQGISEIQYWELERNENSNIDVTLGWSDAAIAGITNPDSVVVVGLNGTVWENFGNGNTGVGPGSSGSVTSLESDPPPFEIGKFTFGFISPEGALPVDLTKFQAVQQNKIVHIQWETASEINTTHYEVERSTDGVKYEIIKTVSATGKGESLQQYSCKDMTPSTGINYYRLKILDKDGTFEYSHIEVIKFESSPELQIYPNPVKKMIQIKGKDLGENLIEVFDRNGKRIYLGNMVFENEFFSIPTETANIKNPGTYFLRITNKSGSTVLKFIKIN